MPEFATIADILNGEVNIDTVLSLFEEGICININDGKVSEVIF